MVNRVTLLMAAALASSLGTAGVRAETAAPDAAPSANSRTLGEAATVKADTDEITVGFDRPAGVYAIGEAVGLFVEARKDAYVTVITVSPKGEIVKLFPNAGQRENFLRAGTRIQVPDPATGARLQVFGPVGKENIRVFSSSRPLTLFADISESGSGTFRSLDGGEPALARSLNAARATGAKISSGSVLLTTVETLPDPAAVPAVPAVPVKPRPTTGASAAQSPEKPKVPEKTPDSKSPSQTASIDKTKPTTTQKPPRKPADEDDAPRPAAGDALLGPVPAGDQKRTPQQAGLQQTKTGKQGGAGMPQMKMPQLKMPNLKLPGGFGIKLPTLSMGRSLTPQDESTEAEAIEVVEAKSPPCNVLVDTLNAAVAARDLAAASAGVDAIAGAADCGQFQVPAQRRLSALALAQAQEKMSAGAPVEEYEPLLALADRPQVLWQASATLAETHFASRQFAEAAREYQNAIEIIKNETRTPKAPEEATILDLLDRAAKARILAANASAKAETGEEAQLVEAPRDHRSGLIGGVYSSDVRSIVPKSIPIPVTFDFNQSTLTPVGQDAARELLEAVKEQKPGRIVLVGHADRKGSDDYNMKLSASRAEAVAAFLKQNGVEAEIVAEGRGASEPIGAPTGLALSDDDVDALNRRVEWRRQ